MQNTVEVALAQVDILEKLRSHLMARQIYLTKTKSRDRISENLEAAKMVNSLILEIKKSPKEWPVNASCN